MFRRSLSTFCRFAAVTTVAALAVQAQSQSPFVPPASASAPAAPADAEYEFTGLIDGAKGPLINITRLADKRTYWLKLGESTRGIHLESFDAENQSAVIRVDGRDRTLALKRVAAGGSGNGAASYVAPLPMATVAPRVAVTNEEKATEARMLVSDLLEIGMVQRKAYEEAQRRAAAGGDGDTPTPATSAAPSAQTAQPASTAKPATP